LTYTARMQYERIEVPVTDGVAWVRRTTPNQLISIGDKVWSEKRKRIIQDLKDADVESADRVSALSKHDKSRGLMSEIIEYAMGMEGALEILRVASESEGSENAENISDRFAGTANDAVSIAVQVLGIQFEKESASKSKKKK